MDPLSVSASIIGVLGAAAKVSSVLITFVQNTKAAPQLAQIVLAEVNGLSAVLGHLQTYLIGVASPSKSRASLILVEQVIVTLAECVITFSELEDVLGTSQSNGEMGTLDRMKWAWKESKVSDILRRLQSNKASLTLMLSILQCKSMDEAESAMTRLCDLVEQVLASNQDMSRRIRNMDDTMTHKARSTNAMAKDDESSTSGGTTTPPPDDVGQNVQRNQLGFAFEEDLLASRVYRKPLFSNSGESLVTSAARTTASSILSALSLTDVSNISILAVPIYARDISNSNRYSFGDFVPELPEVESQNFAPQTSKKPLIGKKWDSFAAAVSRRRRARSSQADAVIASSAHQEPTVLGVSLYETIKFANVAISLINEKGESYIYGYIPLYVGKIGVFLKEKATDVENIFCVSGSPIRLQKLERTFDQPPRYGKSLDWTGYTVHEAASILMRFLLRLPEPLIPLTMYEMFQTPLRPSMIRGEFAIPPSKQQETVREYQHLVRSLPALSRMLLLYLLDLLAVFASHSETNKMTSARLAAVFQPTILSPVKAGEDYIEEEESRGLSQKVLTYLIDNQDAFLIGMHAYDQ